ncbi:pentapeptide repeat-containing protein [Micromonospora aurantiaca (nom. illeg.)]|uniref:pentapeptide repeat-containing protein n=1 Tax=Micromonospora aurantiaca (nom. illeg.) TaxID=47850 RepID=UPI0036AE8A33
MKVAKPRTYRPIHLATLITLLVIALAVTAVAAWFMWDAAKVPAGLPSSPELAVRAAQLRVDVIRNILAVGAGTGGLIALFLALRRQYVKERVDYDDQAHKNRTAEDARHDAGERRVTDLYVKAAEQLGSEKAAVRLAALYALERLGQDNPEHRQTIVNLICAYLRMPFDLPNEAALRTNFGMPTDDGSSAYGSSQDGEREKRQQESEVRVAAQRILSKHLHYSRLLGGGEARKAFGQGSFWEGMEVDLAGASLIHFDLSHCAVDRLTLDSARFFGSANFNHLYSAGSANFARASFMGPANFYNAHFNSFLIFSLANFQHSASFDSAWMGEGCSFQRVIFRGAARFRKTRCDVYMFHNALAALAFSSQHIWPEGFALVEDEPEGYGAVVEIAAPDDHLERDWDDVEVVSPEVPQQPTGRDPADQLQDPDLEG